MDNNCLQGNKRADTKLMLIAIILVAAAIVLYVIYVSSASAHFQGQNYNNFACKYMLQNQEFLSIDKDPLWFVPGANAIQAKPFEATLGTTSCGLVLPSVTNNTGNITALIRNYSMSACEYGNNNTYDQFVWVRSLPVNVTDGDVDYDLVKTQPSPPGLGDCYLLWRINTSSIDVSKSWQSSLVLEQTGINGTIKRNILTYLQIIYAKGKDVTGGSKGMISIYGRPV